MVCINPAIPAHAANSSIVLLARILDAAGRPMRATDVVAIICTVREVDSCVAVAKIDVNPFGIILWSLVRDQAWTVDDVGYNFRHDLSYIADIAGLAVSEFRGRVEVRYDFVLVDCTRVTVRFHLKLV